MEYQDPQYPSHYPGQPHIPVRRKRVTFRKHIKNQWNNSRGFFKQWWLQKTNKQQQQQQQQQPASYYPPPKRVQAFQDRIKDGENIIKTVGCWVWTVGFDGK